MHNHPTPNLDEIADPADRLINVLVDEMDCRGPIAAALRVTFSRRQKQDHEFDQ